jgi:hypothetical protein
MKIPQKTAVFFAYTVPKIRQISEKIREEVPWRENFPVIRGNDDYLPRITGKFSLQGSSSSLPAKICQILGTVYNSSDQIDEAQNFHHSFTVGTKIAGLVYVKGNYSRFVFLQ